MPKVPAVRETQQYTDRQYDYARQEHAFLLRCECFTRKKIGERLGVSQEQVRRLECQLLKRLRRAMLRTRFYYAA